MFDIEIRGQIKNKLGIRQLCDQVLHHLMPRTTRNIDIEIEFVKQCEDHSAGYCFGGLDFAHIVIAKSSCDEPYQIAEILETLCHELVHAKQFIKGELQNGYVWKGKLYQTDDRTQQPWEQEADQMQAMLFEKFKHLI
jgi:hypothetical protein